MLGTASDERIRRNHPREDTRANQFDINSMRKKVYYEGVSIASKTLMESIGKESLTPIRVCEQLGHSIVGINSRLL